MRRNSSNTDLFMIEKIMTWNCEYWYYYVVQGLRNEIQGNARKS